MLSKHRDLKFHGKKYQGPEQMHINCDQVIKKVFFSRSLFHTSLNSHSCTQNKDFKCSKKGRLSLGPYVNLYQHYEINQICLAAIFVSINFVTSIFKHFTKLVTER